MSTFLRRGFTLLLLLLTAVLLHPVDTTAQNLPGWAEPSEQRQSRFESRSYGGYQSRAESDRQRRPNRNNDVAYSPGAVKTGVNGVGGWENKAKKNGPGNVNGCNGKGNKDSQECIEYCQKPENQNNPACDGVPVPVDDYLPLLMLAGIAYAALRLRQ